MNIPDEEWLLMRRQAQLEKALRDLQEAADKVEEFGRKVYVQIFLAEIY